jgi:hypothetical protein
MRPTGVWANAVRESASTRKIPRRMLANPPVARPLLNGADLARNIGGRLR